MSISDSFMCVSCHVDVSLFLSFFYLLTFYFIAKVILIIPIATTPHSITNVTSPNVVVDLFSIYIVLSYYYSTLSEPFTKVC